MSEPSERPDLENPIDGTVAEIIRWKARSLVGRAGLTRQDCPDLEQELALRVLVPLGAYDAARGTRPAYARALVERFAANLLRDRRAAKRDVGPLAPLPAELPARADEGTGRARAVAAAVAALPPDLRVVAESVMTRTVAATARALGVSRSTVYARLRELRGRTEFRALDEIP